MAEETNNVEKAKQELWDELNEALARGSSREKVVGEMREKRDKAKTRYEDLAKEYGDKTAQLSNDKNYDGAEID